MIGRHVYSQIEIQGFGLPPGLSKMYRALVLVLSFQCCPTLSNPNGRELFSKTANSDVKYRRNEDYINYLESELRSLKNGRNVEDDAKNAFNNYVAPFAIEEPKEKLFEVMPLHKKKTRKFLSWFNKIFNSSATTKKSTVKNTQVTTTQPTRKPLEFTTTKIPKEVDNFASNKPVIVISDEPRNDSRNALDDLVTAIGKLTKAVEEASFNIISHNRNTSPLRVAWTSSKRTKRDTLVSEFNSLTTPIASVIAMSNDTVVKNSSEILESVIKNDNVVNKNVTVVRNDALTNQTEKDEDDNLEETELPCNESISGRRSYNIPDQTTSAVKLKLLAYLEESFKEIVSKLNPVNEIKNSFSGEDVYKVGYVVANIDTLAANLRSLKIDMYNHKYGMDDKNILDLLDKLMASNKVVTSLMDALSSYAKKTAF